MDIQKAVQVLKKHQKWRKGLTSDMQDPKVISEAYDVIIEYFRRKSIG